MIKGAKKEPLFQSIVHYLQEQFSALPDYRQGSNRFITMKDIGLSAFSVFFNQCPSFLEHQRLMQRRLGKSNAKSLFGIEHIPSDNQVRQLLDPIPPSTVFPVFHYALNRVKEAGLLERFGWQPGQVLIAIDGLHYFSSKEISCERCSTKQHRNGSKTYHHSMVSATIVHPECEQVLPLPPEFIEPQDGHDKQDCERAAFKRWLGLWGNHYSGLGATILGDDLYACQPIAQAVLASGLHFIFTCQAESHQYLYDWLGYLGKSNAIGCCEHTVTTKGKRYTYRCRYVNQVPLRESADALQVNWCSVEVLDKQAKRIYQGAFVTDHLLTDENVAAVAQAGRTRWKTENEHNNTLKNQGYYLSHNFGHGKQHLASLLATLILLSFLFHTLLALLDKRYQQIRGFLPRRMFFQQLRTVLFYMYFATWEALMECMLQACEIEVPDSS